MWWRSRSRRAPPGWYSSSPPSSCGWAPEAQCVLSVTRPWRRETCNLMMSCGTGVLYYVILYCTILYCNVYIVSVQIFMFSIIFVYLYTMTVYKYATFWYSQANLYIILSIILYDCITELSAITSNKLHYAAKLWLKTIYTISKLPNTTTIVVVLVLI